MAGWANVTLGQDVRNNLREEQDSRWAQSVSDGRAHVSDREFVLSHRQEAMMGILQYYSVIEVMECLYPRLNDIFVMSNIMDFAYNGHGRLVFTLLEDDAARRKHKADSIRSPYFDLFRVYARKRPLQNFERAIGCYDACNASNKNNTVLLHDCKLARNGRQLNMTHREYVFDEVFDQNTSNMEMCTRTVEPLLSWVMSGKDATFICFGQTGTGKTYTLMGVMEYLSDALVGMNLSVKFFEIHGKRCLDLFSDRRVVHVRTDGEGTLHTQGAKEWNVMIRSPGDFMSLVNQALALRSCEETERNSISSRSHAVCTIQLHNFGTLTLVDLAGSERNYETVQMTAAQHRESADINYTLMCLKDCLHAYHSQLCKAAQKNPQQQNLSNFMEKVAKLNNFSHSTRIPFRSCLLTRVLRNCFDNNLSHRTTILATISPSPVDIQHSINTLDHVVLTSPKLQNLISSVTLEIPKYIGVALSTTPVAQWTHREVIAWLSTGNLSHFATDYHSEYLYPITTDLLMFVAENGRFANIVIPPGLTGKGLLRLDRESLADLFAGDIRSARQEEEGQAWTIEDDNRHSRDLIAQALFAALRWQNLSSAF